MPAPPPPPGAVGPPPGPAGRRLAAWVERARRSAPWVVLGFAVLAAVALLGPARRLGVDTDTADMLSERLPWRQALIRYEEAFPQYAEEMVILVEGETPELADGARRRLAERLRRETELYRSVYAPGGGAFFRRHGLLYRSVAELDSLVTGVERYGSWLRRLERDPSLGGFLAALEDLLAAGRRGDPDAIDPAPVLGAVAEAFGAPLGWRFHRLSWTELLSGRRATEAERRTFLLVRPRLDYGSFLPAEEPLARARAVVAGLGLGPSSGVRVRFTGEVAMEHEELRSALRGAARAGLLALVAVGLILWLGLRSVRLVGGSVLTLLAGLAATVGFAAVTVGHLNLISIAFAVLLIGLGIDYAIHFCLRYRELGPAALRHGAALAGAAADVGPGIALSAVTTAVCFYAFVPTDFTGVSELGLISGTGMLIALLATLTLLPALLTVWRPRGPDAPAGRGRPPEAADASRPAGAAPRPAAAGVPDGGAAGEADRGGRADVGPLDLLVRRLRRIGGGIAAAPSRHPRRVLVAAAAVGAGCLPFLPELRFDHNPLQLRDPQTESVATYLELLADSTAFPLTVATLEPDGEAAAATAARLEALDVVEGALTLADFVPAEQEEKRRRIEAIAEAMGPPPVRPPGAADPAPGAAETPVPAAARGVPGAAGPGASAARLDGVRELLAALAAFRPFASSEAAGAARHLGVRIRAWLDRVEGSPPETRPAMVERLEESLVGSLPTALEDLRASLDPGRVEREDLPPELVERWVSPSGLHRVEALPREDVAATAALRRFVEGVRSVAPHATGAPVAELAAGDAVVEALREAVGYAVLATAVLLLAVFRRARDAGLVLLPLLLAGLVTAGGSAALGLPLNFANVIALPLLLGVGVDNGIHMVHRARNAPPPHGDLLRTSTARAIVLSSLTTVAGFGNLALAGHRGMASMGTLLTLGMAAVVVSTLAVLPALLRSTPPRSTGRTGPDTLGR